MEEISADPAMTKMSAGCLTETAHMREEGYSRPDICRFDPLPRSLVHSKYDVSSPTTASSKSLRETSLVGRTKMNSRSSYIVGEAPVEGPVVFDDIGDNVGTGLYPLPIGDYDGSPRRYGLRLVDPHGQSPRQDSSRPHSFIQNIESTASDSSTLIDNRSHEMYNPLHDFDNSNQQRVVKYLPTCIGDFSLETAGYVKSSSYFSSNDRAPTADETKTTDSCFEDCDYDSQFLKCIPHKGKTSPEEEVCYQKSISPFGFLHCNDTSMLQDNTSSVVSNPPSLMCSLGNDETMTVEMLSAGRPQISVRNGIMPLTSNVKPVIFTPVSVPENPKSHQLAFDSLASSPERGIFLLGSTVLGRHSGHGHVAFSPGTTECDSGESDLSEEVSVDSSGRAFGVLPTVEDGLSSGHVSDDEYQGSDQAQKSNTKDKAYVTKAINQGGHNQLQQQIVSQFTEQALGQINSYGDHPIENGLIDINIMDPLNRDSASFPFAASYPQPSGSFHINHSADVYGASSGHAFSHDQDVPFHHMSTANKKGSQLSGDLFEPAVSTGLVGMSFTTADSRGRNAGKSSRTIDGSFQCQQVASLPVDCLHEHRDRKTEFAQNSPESSSTCTHKFGKSVSSDRDVSRPIPGSSLSTANSILDDVNYLSNDSAPPVTHSNYSGSQPRLSDVGDTGLIPKSPPFAEKNEVQAAIHDIRLAIRRTSSIAAASVSSTDTAARSGRPVWVPRRSGYQKLSTTCDDPPGLVRSETDEIDTDQETDRLLGQQRQHSTETTMPEKSCTKKEKSKDVYVHEPAVLIEGVLFRARYLGSTQLMCDGQPTKSTRMTQAEEAVSRVKVPDGETQPSTDVDLFISTEKIMVLNTDLKEIMMDHALRTISYIADIGDLVVLMARRRITKESGNETSETQHLPRMICHVFESEEAQFIAQSIGQAFQVAYLEFLKANGIEDHSFFKEMDYQDVLNSQEIFGEELRMFAKKELQKEVIVPKQKTEILGVVIVESGWGSLVPTVVIANMAPGGAAARCGLLNIGDQIIAINGVSLVGLPLSTCQHYVKNARHLTAVKLTVVPCAPVVVVRIRRPDTKYQLGFSVQNGVICSLLRGGIAERGGVRVGHRIIEINGQSVVAVAHQRIVSLLANSIGEILMKTMPTSLFRLLTGQETPTYI